MKIYCMLGLIALLYAVKGGLISRDEAEDFDDDAIESQITDDDVEPDERDIIKDKDPRPLVLWCRRGRRKVCRYYKKCSKKWWSRKVTCRYVRRCSCECPKGTYYGCVWLWKKFCWKVFHATFCHGRKSCKCRPRATGDIPEHRN